MDISSRSLATVVVVVFLAMISSVCALVGNHRATDWHGLSEAGPLPISIEEAPKLFDQCSRSAPKYEGAVWLPQENEIRDLEQRLGSFLAQKEHLHDYLMEGQLSYAYLNLNPDLGKYRAQFVGFERDGKRYIYAAYLAHSVALSGAQGDNAIIFCSDVAAAWGIVYDLQRKKLGEFAINGER